MFTYPLLSKAIRIEHKADPVVTQWTCIITVCLSSKVSGRSALDLLFWKAAAPKKITSKGRNLELHRLDKGNRPVTTQTRLGNKVNLAAYAKYDQASIYTVCRTRCAGAISQGDKWDMILNMQVTNSFTRAIIYWSRFLNCKKVVFIFTFSQCIFICVVLISKTFYKNCTFFTLFRRKLRLFGIWRRPWSSRRLECRWRFWQFCARSWALGFGPVESEVFSYSIFIKSWFQSQS